MLKKGDIAVFFGIILIALLLFFVFLMPKENGNTLIIMKDNAEYGRYPLSEDAEIDLGTNIAVIKDSYAYMKSADCPDQICVKHEKINKKGETVICLPNKILLKIE